MLKELYTIKRIYADFEIYIWNTNISSMVMFGRLALKGVNISGFLSDRTEFCSKCIMNRIIIGFDEMQGKSHVLLIIPDENEIEVLQKRFDKDKVIVLNYSDSLEISKEIESDEIYIYGTGGGCRGLEQALDEEMISFEGYIESKVAHRMHNGKKVYDLNEVCHKKGCTVIVSTLNRNYTAEILDILQEKEFKNVYVYAEIANLWYLRTSSTFTLVDYAFKENKTILIYDSNGLIGNLVKKILDCYGIYGSEFVDDYELYDKVSDDTSQYLIFIPDINEYKVEEKCNFLEKIGISLSQYQYTGLGLVERKISKENFVPDCMMGYAFENEYYGIDIIGNKEAKFRVIVLGGSTSTVGYYRVTSWVEILYEKLQNTIGDVVIFNMGFLANDVVTELLKLLRDGYYLKPNCVISLSGVNNTFEKGDSVNQFVIKEDIQRLNALGIEKYYTGIEVREDLFGFWVRIQKIIKCVSELFGAKYIGILQPMNIAKKNKSLFETMYFEDYMYEKCSSFYDESSGEDFFINMINEFWDKDGMYVDHCHYSKQANAIIANKIYEKMLAEFEF